MRKYEEILNGTFDISSNRANQQMSQIWRNMIKYDQISSNLTERFFQMKRNPPAMLPALAITSARSFS
jgi:hypothetical protein